MGEMTMSRERNFDEACERTRLMEYGVLERDAKKKKLKRRSLK